MSDPEPFEYEISESIRRIAMAFPEATEGSSCVNRAFRAGAKNFVFVGEKDETCVVRLKLEASRDALAARAETDQRFEVGSGGWTKLVFAPDDAPGLEELQTWVRESFLLLAPRRIAAQLGD